MKIIKQFTAFTLVYLFAAFAYVATSPDFQKNENNNLKLNLVSKAK